MAQEEYRTFYSKRDQVMDLTNQPVVNRITDLIIHKRIINKKTVSQSSISEYNNFELADTLVNRCLLSSKEILDIDHNTDVISPSKKICDS